MLAVVIELFDRLLDVEQCGVLAVLGLLVVHVAPAGSELLEGRDVVIASRYRPGARVIGLSLFRRFMSFAARTLFVCLFPVSGVRDYTCGYRAYRCQILRQAMKSYRDQFISEDGFSCMVDILIKLNRQGAIFGEVPMILRYDLKHGASKMRVGRTIVDTLKLAAKRRLDFLHTRETR